MKKIILLFVALIAVMALSAQTMNVKTGHVVYQIPAEQAGEMLFANGTTLTIEGKTFTLSDIDEISIDDTQVTDNTVSVQYNGAEATVYVAGNVAQYVTATVSGAHVSIVQGSDVSEEITYTLSGSSTDGEFTMTGSYKATVELAGLTLTNPAGAAIDIENGKRIELSVKKDTENTLTDGSGGQQKAALYCKGHLELKGKGTLTVYGNTAHGIKSAEYMTMKNCIVNVLKAVKDGLSCDEYFLMESGTLTISGTGDDAIQVDLDGTVNTGETTGHEDEDSGNAYLLGGTLNLNVTANAAKGIKAAGNVVMKDGSLTVTQTGSIIADADLSYPTSVKAGGDIVISGGTINISNTADGGKGLSADGAVSIDESNTTVTIDITANGKGGTAETTGESTEPEVTTSYKVYVSLPTTGGMGPGGGNAWKSVYLYKNDGTLVQKLTSTVTKSNGYSNVTFYYYDFGQADTDTYYFKSDNYTSRNTTYTIRSATFSGPSTGTDIYYSISNSYQTSGSTRTYQLSNVTNTYGGSSDVSEDNGTAYNAMGIKADGNISIKGGTITVKNSGSMSKSMKSKATVTIDGGNITLTPSGQMQVINNDASYSSAIKAKDFVLNGGMLTIKASSQAGRGVTANNITANGGTLSITNSGAGVQGSSDNYTAKGLKADTSIKLNAGTITINMSGTGGKGIKSAGTYTQGTSDGSGPVLTVNTTGSSLGNTGGGGGMFPGGGGGMGGSSGSSAKAIKVQGTIYIYGGQTEVSTQTNGAEGLESKTAVYIEGGKHYFFCYDDCINSAGNIYFNGGATVCYSNGNDAVDSNAGRSGAITIGNGAVMAYTSKGSPEEGLDCDNNSYIQITGTGIAISAGGAQGGGSSSSTISNAKQGYRFLTSTLSYKTGTYYTLADASGNNLVTYSLQANVSSTLSLITATGMAKGSTYYIKSSTTALTDATTAWHGLYLGSTATGTTSVTSFTAQ